MLLVSSLKALHSIYDILSGIVVQSINAAAMCVAENLAEVTGQFTVEKMLSIGTARHDLDTFSDIRRTSQ